MRLRQISRKLEIKTDKILEFLAKSGHEMENDANGKLTAEQVVLVEAEFPAPFIEEEVHENRVEEVVVPIIEVETKIEVEKKVEEKDVAAEFFNSVDKDLELEVSLAPPEDVTSQVSDKIKKQIEEVVEPTKKSVRLFKALEEPADDPNIELIKAPTVQLEGLKVLGKIDLPEPKVKVEPAVKEVEKEVPKKRIVKPAQNRQSTRTQDANPIERERLRQAKIAARRKRDAKKKLKEKKEANYRQQLKSSPAQPKPKRKKKVVAPKVAVTTSAPILGQTRDKAPAQKPKQNKLRKFWGWLNGEYDKY